MRAEDGAASFSMSQLTHTPCKSVFSGDRGANIACKARCCLCALERAIANRKPPSGVVHHSRQGVPYASQE
jgi:hypothetical protein